MNARVRSALFLMTVSFAMLARSFAQGVVGVSAVMNSTNANEVDGYSSTEITDANTAYWYDAYVVGNLYQDETKVDPEPGYSPCNINYADNYSCSEADTSSPVHQGSNYTVESDHYLIAYVEYSDGTFYNPEQYLFGNYFYNPGEGGDPSGTGFDPGGGDTYIQEEDIYLGYTYVQISTAPPSISSISPSSDVQGASGTINVQGQNLRDDLGVLSASFRDSDITVSVASGNATTASLNYSISSNASIGSHQLVLTNTWGDSEPKTFTVGYPPAVVTSLSPSNWTAGSSFTLTINGTGFGNSPSVSISASGVQYGPAMNTRPDGSQTQVNVSVAADAPSQTATVTITPGYTGNSYICGNCNGGSPSGTNTASVQAISPSPPVILDGLYASNQCQGTPISNPAGGGDNNQNVVVGQLIQFTACIPQAGVSIASSSWSVNDGQFTDKATAGFNPVLSATNTSAPYQPVIATTTCNPNQSYCDYGVGTTSTGFSASGFYFVTQGTYTFTFTYQLNNGTPSVSASVTYVVTGPTAIGDASGTYGPGQQLVCQDSYLLCTTSGETEQLENRFGNGYYLDFSGISFSNHSSAPSGSSGAYQFIQVLAPRLVRYLDSAGVRQPCQTPSGQLDVTYPYATYSRGDELAVDAPGVPLMYDCDGNADSQQGEISDSFSATMYLLWDPQLNASGQSTPDCAATTPETTQGLAGTPVPSTCTGSIPAPLGAITWGFCGGAINVLQTQSDGSTWTLNCKPNVDMPATPTYQDAHSISTAPSWTGVKHD